MHHKTKSHSAVSFFYYVGNIVLNLQRRYDGKTRKSTFKYTIAEGDFLFTGQVWHRQQKILPFNSSIDSIFYYGGNIVRNLQRRYDGITRKSTAGCAIAEGDFLIFYDEKHRNDCVNLCAQRSD